MKLVEIPWTGVATLLWDGDEVCDITSGQRGNLAGSVTPKEMNMTYRFDRAVGVRTHDAHWAAAYTNRGTKAVLMKNGSVHRELNRSFYCAESYDYPIVIGADPNGRAIVIHCPNKFDLLEMEDAETGRVLDSLTSKEMEFHSCLSLSPDGRFLADAGWFWHPWCGAVVFELTCASDGTFQFTKSTEPSTVFSAQNEVDSVAFLGNTHLVVSSASDYFGQDPKPGDLEAKKLGVWSLADHKWESRVDLSEPVGMLMPWKEWVVSFFGHPKLIEIATGRVVHRWDNIYSGNQLGPIDLGDPPPPPIAIDALQGRFAVADSKSVTIVCL